MVAEEPSHQLEEAEEEEEPQRCHPWGGEAGEVEGHRRLPRVALAVGEEAAHSILPGHAWAAAEAEEGRPRCLRSSEEAVGEAEVQQTRPRR